MYWARLGCGSTENADSAAFSLCGLQQCLKNILTSGKGSFFIRVAISEHNLGLGRGEPAQSSNTPYMLLPAPLKHSHALAGAPRAQADSYQPVICRRLSLPGGQGEPTWKQDHQIEGLQGSWNLDSGHLIWSEIPGRGL